MTKITSIAIFFLAAGIFTSVTVLGAYQILFAIPLAYYTFLAVKEKNFKLPLSAWFLLAFAVVALLSLVINYDLIPKPSKNFGRIKYFIYGIGGIFVLKAWAKNVSDQTKKILVNTFFVSMVIAGGYTIWYNFSHNLGAAERSKGLTETMRYGYGTGMALLMLFTAIFHQEKLSKWFNWKAALPAIVFGFLGIYFIQTRGSILCFLCGLPFVLYFYRPKVGLVFGMVAVLALSALGGFYLFGKSSDPRTINRFLVNKNNSSDVIRRSQWQAAIIATKEKPILGWGFSNFSTQVERIKNQYDLDAKDYIDAHAHNLFLEIAAGTGLLGFTCFLAWLMTWAVDAFKAGGLTRAFIVPFGVAFVVCSQLEVTFDANNATMIFFLYSMTYANSDGKKVS